MRSIPVPPSKVGAAWPFIERWVAAALDRGKADLAPADIRQHLISGSMQLWLVWAGGRPRGCCIAELVESVRGRACNLVVVAGEGWQSWQHLLDDVAQWATARGCVRLALTGRRGWARRLPGWSETAVTLERGIGSGSE